MKFCQKCANCMFFLSKKPKKQQFLKIKSGYCIYPYTESIEISLDCDYYIPNK